MRWFEQPNMGHHEDPSAAEPQANLGSLSQRRKGAKFLRKFFFQSWRSWRLGEMNIRIRCFVPFAGFVVKTHPSSLPALAGLHDFRHYVRLSSLALMIPRTFAVSLLAWRRPEQKKLFNRIDAKSP
jgi:hypothetical protein